LKQYPRFCHMPSSLSVQAQAAPSLMGVTHPHRCGGDASERSGAYGQCDRTTLPPLSPPHAPCSSSWRSHLARGVANPAGALLPHPFTPHLSLAAIGGSALCCRLTSARCYHPTAPAYGFAGQHSSSDPSRSRSREVPLVTQRWRHFNLPSWGYYTRLRIMLQ
jgi:hypothetical protein